MEAIKPWLSKLEKELEKKNQVTDLIGQASAATGVSKMNLTLAASSLFCLIFIFCFGGDLLISFIGTQITRQA